MVKERIYVKNKELEFGKKFSEGAKKQIYFHYRNGMEKRGLDLIANPDYSVDKMRALASAYDDRIPIAALEKAAKNFDSSMIRELDYAYKNLAKNPEIIDFLFNNSFDNSQIHYLIEVFNTEGEEIFNKIANPNYSRLVMKEIVRGYKNGLTDEEVLFATSFKRNSVYTKAIIDLFIYGFDAGDISYVVNLGLDSSAMSKLAKFLSDGTINKDIVLSMDKNDLVDLLREKVNEKLDALDETMDISDYKGLDEELARVVSKSNNSSKKIR